MGDYDGDGDLDLAVGNNYTNPSEIYCNEDGTFNDTPVWTSLPNEDTYDIEWVDYDGDGDLDLSAINFQGAHNLYRNDSVNGQCTSSFSQFSITSTNRITDTALTGAWGDYDNDGDLDFAVANSRNWDYGGAYWYNSPYPNELYRNDGVDGSGAPVFTLAWESDEAELSYDIDWGDIDGDGDLDLVVANESAPNRLYRNDNGVLTTSAIWSSRSSSATSSVALGDYDNDGDLDLAFGNRFEPDAIYRNDAGIITSNPAWTAQSDTATYDIAWSDYDNDGDLDLLAGDYDNGGGANSATRLYRNANGIIDNIPIWQPYGEDAVTSVIWGDIDNDGDQDLITGSREDTAIHIYRNRRHNQIPQGGPPTVAIDQAETASNFVATSDIEDAPVISIPYTLSDTQGAPVSSVHGYYSMDGGGNWRPAITPNGTNVISSGLQVDTPQITYANETTTITSSDVPAEISSDDPSTVESTLNVSTEGTVVDVNVVDLLGEHTWVSDLSVSLRSPSGTEVVLFDGQCGNQDNLDISLDDEATQGIDCRPNRYRGLNDGKTLRPNENLSDFDNEPAAGTWTLVVHDDVVSDGGELQAWGLELTIRTPTVIMPQAANIYEWDTFASGFFGQSDNVVFRLEALPDPAPVANSFSRSYQRGHTATSTAPMRVRGTQVRVMNEQGEGVPDALVYRLGSAQQQGGDLISSLAGDPFITDSQGYLQGRGRLEIGDQLFAMSAAVYSDTHVLYHTSGAPLELGVESLSVATSGEQTLTVSPDHPLILFDLIVALEWDASNNPAYLEQLRSNLLRASQYMYDFTNGQMALGWVTVTQNADDWAYANVVVHSANNVRPYAHQGGIVVTETVDLEHPDIVYDVGQITMGSSWNRYGNPGQNIGDDWAITLAHEFGHYMLFLDDVYIGLNPDGFLVPVDTCSGSAMGDLYVDPNNTEYIGDDAFWQANCAETLTNQTLQRNEWETIALWYEDLNAPTSLAQTNAGPALMPYNFTTIEITDPLTPTDALEDPTFYLDYVNGTLASSQSLAYLMRDDYVVPLGRPTGGQNRIKAYGAQPGDRLCAFDRAQHQYVCEIIELGDERLSMEQDDTWVPVIQLTPVTSTTMDLSADNLPAGLDLKARLYPEYGFADDPITLAPAGDGYQGTFNLEEPAMQGQIQVWVEETDTETNPRRETIVGYSIGGNPGSRRGGRTDLRGGGGSRRGGRVDDRGGGGSRRGGRVDDRGGGGSRRGGRVDLRGGGGSRRGGRAPVVSADGQMTLYTANPLIFQEGDFYTIQSMAGLPALPPGRAVIGQGYNLVATPGAPVIDGAISFEYMTSDVIAANADEQDLTIYFWDGTTWTELSTLRDAYYNVASAQSQGPGIYTLLASVQIGLTSPGWNLISYPLRGEPSVNEALASIDGSYTTVYGYEPLEVTAPWTIYDPSLPPVLNSLNELQFGKGYWINATDAMTVHLSPDIASAPDSAIDPATASVPPPPATYYGTVISGEGFTAEVGQPVVARINSIICGQGTTREVDGQIMYIVTVSADGSGSAAGCGRTGATVTFEVGGQAMATTAAWDTSQVWEVPLSLTAPTSSGAIYLPLVRR